MLGTFVDGASTTIVMVVALVAEVDILAQRNPPRPEPGLGPASPEVPRGLGMTPQECINRHPS